MVTAVSGAILRSIGLSSLVATTAIGLGHDASPSVSSMNSRTSRPRSPTSAMTTLSKASARASIDSSVDLPTPEPAKMPRRCPRQSGAKISIARTPVHEPLLDAACGSSTAARNWKWIDRLDRRPLQKRAAPVDRVAQRVDRAAAPGGCRGDAESALADDRVANADRLARLDRADVRPTSGSTRTTSPRWMPVGAAVRDELAEPHMAREAAQPCN
jgi:hypothetical protein